MDHKQASAVAKEFLRMWSSSNVSATDCFNYLSIATDSSYTPDDMLMLLVKVAGETDYLMKYTIVMQILGAEGFEKTDGTL